MKKILGLVLYAGVMFGVTAGLGMFMMKKQASHSTQAESAGGEEASEVDGSDHGGDASGHDDVTDAGHGADHGGSSSHQSAELPKTDLPGAHAPDHQGNPGRDEQLPVAVRSTPMSVEEIVRMGLSLKSRDEVVHKREEALREIEAQQRLVLSDMASAQQEIENLLAQTTDQRAAKEELLARITSLNESSGKDRQLIASEREALNKERAEFEFARKRLDAEKAVLARSENDLEIKQKSFEEDRKSFTSTQSQVTQDLEKLKSERDTWIKEKEKIAAEKNQLALDQDKLRVDRELLDQEKKIAAAMSGKTPAATAPTNTAEDEAAQRKKMKAVAQMLEGMNAESAAKNIRELATTGNMDMVVEVLGLLEQRKSGAIMDALGDEKLAAEFLLQMSNRNASSKTAKKP